MPHSSPFSADDHIDYDANRPIGDLDASYRAARAGKANGRIGPVKHVPVRDASGSFTNEEPVQAYMMPSKYLAPRTNAGTGEKRPLGSRPAAKKPQAVPMYSQVATFGAMPRVRRSRTTIPVEHVEDRSWMDHVRHYFKVGAALVIAGALFADDKLKEFWKYVSQHASRLWAALPLGHARTTYSAYRGALVRRMGMKDSRFKVIAPLAVLLLVLGLGIFSSFVGENPFAPGRGGNGGSGSNAQQGSTVLNVSSGGKGGGSGGSNAGANGSNNAGTQGGRGGGSPQAAAQAGQSSNGAGSAVQSSPSTALGGGSSPVGGYGGGSGSSAPLSGGGSSLPVTVPSVPSTPTVTAPAPTGGSGGSGSSGGCLCSTIQPVTQPVTNTLNTVTQPAANTVQGVTQQAPSTLNGTTAPATNTISGTGL